MKWDYSWSDEVKVTRTGIELTNAKIPPLRTSSQLIWMDVVSSKMKLCWVFHYLNTGIERSHWGHTCSIYVMFVLSYVNTVLAKAGPIIRPVIPRNSLKEYFQKFTRARSD
jgi:hypothetical protein